VRPPGGHGFPIEGHYRWFPKAATGRRSRFSESVILPGSFFCRLETVSIVAFNDVGIRWVDVRRVMAA